MATGCELNPAPTVRHLRQSRFCNSRCQGRLLITFSRTSVTGQRVKTKNRATARFAEEQGGSRAAHAVDRTHPSPEARLNQRLQLTEETGSSRAIARRPDPSGRTAYNPAGWRANAIQFPDGDHARPHEERPRLNCLAPEPSALMTQTAGRAFKAGVAQNAIRVPSGDHTARWIREPSLFLVRRFSPRPSRPTE